MKKYQDKDKARIQRMIAQMCPSEKLQYYWNTYWMHILIGILCVTGVISMAVSICNSIERNSFLQIVLQDSCLETLTPQFNEFAQKSGLGEKIVIHTSYDFEEDPTGTEFMHLISVMSAGNMDIAVLDQVTIDHLLAADGVLNAFDIYPIDLTHLKINAAPSPLFLLINQDSTKTQEIKAIYDELIQANK